MARGRGQLNKNAIIQIMDTFSAARGIFAEEVVPGEFRVTQRTEAIRYRQNNAVQAGVGRQIIGAGSAFATVGSGNITVASISGVSSVDEVSVPTVSPGSSGVILPTSGLYHVTGHVSVSGTANAIFTSDITLDGGIIDDTTAWTTASAAGAAFVPVNGIIGSEALQVLNVNVSSPTSTVTVIGAEDLNGAPHLNISIFKLSSDADATNI